MKTLLGAALTSALTAKQLRSALDYNSETGVFSRRVRENTSENVRLWNGRYAGKAAGYIDMFGYVSIKIGNIAYRAHRLAWLYMTGNWPPDEIDHIDMNKSNNSWKNLRCATRAQNQGNTRVQRNNLSGLKGVSAATGSKKYPFMARITVAGRTRSVGRFKTKAEGFAAYQDAAIETFGEYSRAS